MIALGPTRLDISTELHESLGFVPLHRIGTDPPPGTATEADVIRYQEGEPNFAVIKEWNAAKVYQQAIAIMGARIDG